MRVFTAFVLLLASPLAWPQEESLASPTLLRSDQLESSVDQASLQRQFDALGQMQLRSIEYSAQGPIQDLDGDTGVVLPRRVMDLKKGDSGNDVLQLFKDVLLATGRETLELRDNTLVDPHTRNLTFSQSIRGIPVVYGVVTVEVEVNSRRVTGITANFIPERNLPTEPKVSAQEAEQVVPAALETAGDARAKNVEVYAGTYLGYFANPTVTEPPSLVWVIRAELSGGDRVDFLVDAQTGEIVYHAPADSSLTRAVYNANFAAIPYPNTPSQYKLTTAQIYANPTATEAYDNVYKASAYMSGLFPSAVGNLPQTLRILINYGFSSPNGKHYLDGSTDYLIFSGDSQLKYSYGKPLNIVTHEFMHGFSQREIGPNFTLTDNQAGALRESFSDIMGVEADVVDGANAGPLSDVWVHGHGLYKSGPENGSRSFKDPMADVRAYYAYHAPASVDWFPSRVRGVYVGSPSGDHENSTILSHAYYLLVFGGMHARAVDPEIPDITVTAQGENKARNIFMRAFQDGSLNSQPTFLKMKTAAIAAANSLYPGTGANTATRKAFEAVGVCGVSAGPPPQMSLTSVGDLLCAGRFNPTWNVVTGATQYYGEVAPQQLGFGFAVPVTNVDGATTHCLFQVSQPSVFHIQACNDCGCGPWSQTYSLPYWSPCP